MGDGRWEVEGGRYVWYRCPLVDNIPRHLHSAVNTVASQWIRPYRYFNYRSYYYIYNKLYMYIKAFYLCGVLNIVPPIRGGSNGKLQNEMV